MQKIFRTQKITAVMYTVMVLVVFLFTLVFMTEYKDLFGLKLKQNSQISFFHDSVLQTFNRQIFLLALVGILIALFSFFLEIYSKVPDKFALIIMEALLLACCAGTLYGLTNIQAIEAFYQTLDFQYLELEGLVNYTPHFTTFQIGTGIYLMQILICIVYGGTMAASHITYGKNEKKRDVENGR